MPGATLLDPNGVTTWTNGVDNWRAEDADFLQKRTVLRFADAASRATYLGTGTRGQVTYLESDNSLSYAVFESGSTGWRRITAFQYLGYDDTSTSVGMRISSDVSNSLVLETGKAVLGPNRSLIVGTASITVKTGSKTVTLTTSATDLVSDSPITAPSATVTALSAGSITNTGAFSTGSVTASGAVQAGSFATAGTATLGNTNVSSLTSSSNLDGSTVYGTTSVRGGSVKLSGTKVSNNGAAASYVNLEDTLTTVAGDGIVLAPTATTTAVRYGSATGYPMAVVVVSATDPGASTLPEGTLWIQP